MVNQSTDRQVSWLPNERFEISLDARQGALTSPGGGPDTLTVTNQRAIRVGTRLGRRRTMLVPLAGLSGIEVVDVSRPQERLTQGLIVFGAGFILVWISWVVFATALISLLVGGIPVLVGVYVLAGYAFPEGEGELVLHSAGFSVHQPLLSADARRDAYLVAQRISELTAREPESGIELASMPEAAAPTPPTPETSVPQVGDGPATGERTPEPPQDGWSYRSSTL